MAKANPPIEQNSSDSRVVISATYRLLATLRQNGMRSRSRSMFDRKASPNHIGGGIWKISVRVWVANTNMK